MIVKLQLDRDQFAGLASFIASDDNTDSILKVLNPDDSFLSFMGEETDKRFASILKTAPAKDGSLEVTLLVSEYFRAGERKATPQRYLQELFEWMGLFPVAEGYELRRRLDGDSDPTLHRRFDFFNFLKLDRQKGARHIGMGELLLERRSDGKLYANNIEIVLQPLREEVMQGKPISDDIEERRLVNACVLESLYTSPGLVPSSWSHIKHGYIYFRGTIFSSTYSSTPPFHRDSYVCGFTAGQEKSYWSNGNIGNCNWGSDPVEAVLAE